MYIVCYIICHVQHTEHTVWHVVLCCVVHLAGFRGGLPFSSGNSVHVLYNKNVCDMTSVTHSMQPCTSVIIACVLPFNTPKLAS